MSTIDTSKLKHLAIFSMVVESGSFAAAARKLNTSRSRVSEQVAQLEQDLGVRLIQRSTRQLSLTREGNKIYEQARILPPLIECINDIASTKEPSGTVSLSLSYDVAQTFVLPKLEKFKSEYPNIRLNLVISDNTSDLIEEGIDLAIRTSFRENSSMIARVLYQDKPGIYASSEYIDRNGLPVTIEMLEQHHWITLTQASSDGTQRFILNDKNITVTPTSQYASNSPYMVQQMLLAGLGLGCILPRSMREHIQTGTLIPVLPELQGQELTVSLIYPSRHQVPKRTRCVIDFLLPTNAALSKK